MSDSPVKLSEIVSLISLRERLVKRIDAFDPPKPQPDPLPKDRDDQNALPDKDRGGSDHIPKIKVSASEKREGYNSGSVLYDLSDSASEQVRKIALDEWRDQVTMIDGKLAGIRGVVV